MEDKRSRKPLVIGLLVAIIAVVAAAMFTTPQITPTKVEEQLKAETFLK